MLSHHFRYDVGSWLGSGCWAAFSPQLTTSLRFKSTVTSWRARESSARMIAKCRTLTWLLGFFGSPET